MVGWMLWLLFSFAGRDGFPQTRAQQMGNGWWDIRKKSPTDWVKFSEWEEVTIFLPFFFVERRFADQSWRVIFTKYARWKRNLTHIFGGQLWMSHKWGWFQSDNFFRGWKKNEFFKRVFSDVYYHGRHLSATLQAWNLTWKKKENTGGIMQTCNVLVLHGIFFYWGLTEMELPFTFTP